MKLNDVVARETATFGGVPVLAVGAAAFAWGAFWKRRIAAGLVLFEH